LSCENALGGIGEEDDVFIRKRIEIGFEDLSPRFTSEGRGSCKSLPTANITYQIITIARRNPKNNQKYLYFLIKYI